MTDEDEVELISRKRKHETQLTEEENSKKKRKIISDNDDDAINKNIALEDSGEPEFFNIPEFSRQFGQSRQAYLAKMKSYLNAYDSALAPMIAIIGMGGIGKSQLAKKLAHDMRESFQEHCYWIRANNEVALQNDFEALSHILNIREANRQLMIKAVYRRLNQLDRILLVFDDVPDENSIAAYLPPDAVKKSKFTLLITSRNKIAWSSCFRVELSPSSKNLKEDGIAYLQSFLNQANETELEQQITQLAECLGYLPLALAQAATYIEESQITIKEYIELFEQEKEALLDQPVTRQDNYDLTVRTTWNISFKQVIEKNTKAGKLLNLCAYFAAYEIPKALFLAELTENSQIQFNEIIKLLRSYSLIEDCADRKFFLLHCLLQSVIQLNLKRENNHHTFLRQVMILLNKYFTYRHDAHIDIELINTILVHVLVAIEHCEKANKVKEFSEVAELYYRVGLYYLDYRYDITKAKKYLHHAEAFSKSLNTDAKQAAKIYRQLFKAYLQNAIKAKAKTKAKTAQKKDKYFKQAKLYLDKVQEITGNTLETECDYANYYLTKIEYLNNETLTDEGIQKVKADRDTINQQLNETKKHLDNAFSLLEKLPNLSESCVAMLYHYQGNYHSKFGHYEEAIKAYKGALAIKEKLQDRREMGRTTHALGQIYVKFYQAEKEFKNFIKAYEYLAQALRLKLLIHHTIAHLEVIDTLNVLGGLYAVYDKEDAIVYWEKAILVRLVLAKALITLHRTDVTNDRELVALYFKAGRYAEARQYFDQLPNERKSLLENERKQLFQKQILEYLPKNFPVKPKLEIKDYSAEAVGNLLLIDKMSAVNASYFSSDSNTPQLIATSIELIADDNLKDSAERIPIADSSAIPAWILENLPGLEYQIVPGDGNCLFYVVALYTGKSQQSLRNIAASHIESNLDEFQAFIVLSQGRTLEDYIQALRTGAEWADNIEIEVLMRVLDRPFIVIDSEGKIRNEEALERFNGEPIFVHYNGHNHYNAFLCKKGYSIPAILEQLKQLASYASHVSEQSHAISNESWSEQHEDVGIRPQQGKNILVHDQSNHNSMTDLTDLQIYKNSKKCSNSNPAFQGKNSMMEYQLLAKRLSLAIDHALNTLAEYISQEATRAQIKTILERYKQQLTQFEKMLHDTSNPVIAKLIPTQRTSLENTAESLFVNLDLSNNAEFEKHLIEVIGGELKAIFKMPATLSYEELRHEAKALLFESTLETLRSALQQQTVQGPSCFISYAWGDSAIARKVHKMAQQLVSVGINVVLDIWHNRTNSIVQFTQRVYKEDFVLVMGSSLLKQKYEAPGEYGSYVHEELEHIGIRIKERQDKQKFPFGSGVLKVLVENPHWSAFPDFLKPYPFDETDFTNEHHYYDKFFNLLNLLYVKIPKALEVLSDIKAQFVRESEGLKELKEEELKRYLIQDETDEQKAEQLKSIRDKLEKASAKTKRVSASVGYQTQPVPGVHLFQSGNTNQPQINNNNNSNAWTNYSASNTNTQNYQNPSPK